MNIKNMDITKLEEYSTELTEALARMRHQIQNAKNNVLINNEYSNPIWYSKVCYALKMKGREHQMVQVELAKRRKEAKKSIQKDVDRIFIDLCRQHIDKNLFGYLMGLAVESKQKEATL